MTEKQNNLPAPCISGPLFHIPRMNIHSETSPADEAKRRKILDAALTLFSDHGFHGTSMAKLAKHAKLPVGTIYRHFESKEELIHALYLELKVERYQAMLKNYSDGLSVRARFDIIWSNTYEYCLSHPREFVFSEQYAFSPFLKDASAAIHAVAPPELGRFFEDGYSEGLFKPLSPGIIFALTSGPLNALVRRVNAGLTTLSKSDLDSVRNACWDAIAL
jgi:AcrR family transcriptional regulator